MDRVSFSRFAEKRNYKSSDTAGYDEYVEGVEPEETASLETHIAESNVGYRLVEKMGWKTGVGLGRNGQGRREPIPFNLKDDNMGLGRWSYELEQAQDATEKRKQLEIEKEITADLVEKYKTQAEKDQKLAETIMEMHKSFYCELCDKQYFKYSEFDNHLNSYDHHHRQRLRDLRQWECSRKFGGHRSEEEEREREMAAHAVAVERALMLQRRERRKVTPGFKPIGGEGTSSQSLQPVPASASRSVGAGVKRSSEEVEKVSGKKARIAKYGLKFQSAGNLVTVGDSVRMEEGGKRGRGYRDSVKDEVSHRIPSTGTGSGSGGRTDPPPVRDKAEPLPVREEAEDGEDSGPKFSFGFSKNKKPQYRPRGSGPPEKVRKEAAPGGPPPLMSRQRELMTKAFGGDSDSEGEGEGAELVKMAVRGTPRFMFQIRK